MNPFFHSSKPIGDQFMDWWRMYPRPYDKQTVSPYTRARVILMNGVEFEGCWFTHQLARHCQDNDLRRAVAQIRRQEQQQQKLVSCLKPGDETALEHTIGYEQLEIDLSAELAQREPNRDVRRALEFALLEDLDHLYRYANLLDLESGLPAERLVGGYTEITPGRPTISEHRHPFDSVRNFIGAGDALFTQLSTRIITATEQQTMNFYMNNACMYKSEIGRRLFQEIAMIEEQHVSHYGSLLNPNQTWLEELLMHQYVECYLYYSCHETESDRYIKEIWAALFEQEISHLNEAARLLEQYEGKEWAQLIPQAEFPPPIALQGNTDYIRDILSGQMELTAMRENYVPVGQLPPDFDFFTYQRAVNAETASQPSHVVIKRYIEEYNLDYRFEVQPHPIEPLQNRQRDNTSVGREPQKVYADLRR